MARDPAAVLIEVGRERARLLAPALFAVTLAYSVVFVGSGLVAGPAQIAPPVGLLVAFGALAAASFTRRVPDRWVHLASAATLWCPLAADGWSMYMTREPIFGQLLLVLLASAGVLLSTRLLVGTLGVACALAVPTILHSDAPYPWLFVSAVVTAAVFAVLIHLLMRRALLVAEAHRLAEAEVARRLAQELAALERAQTEGARLRDQLLHSQRLEATGTLAAGVAHDMNNVLGAITSLTELVLARTADPDAQADLRQVAAQAERGAQLTRSLLAFSRRGQYRRQVVRIADVIADVLPLLARTLPKAIEIVTAIDVGDTCVDADAVHLGQVIVNCGLNSSHAMAGKGTLTIAARVVTLADHVALPVGRYVEIAITDTGAGMDEATRRRVFEPFFTTKAVGGGSGLGLAVVWGIVTAHDGAVAVDSALGRGATFTVHLPVTAAAPRARTVPPTVSATRTTATVLLVDDEPAIRHATVRQLERMGLRALTACDGAEGLQVQAAHPEIDLVILDMGMPVMGGAECFWKLRARTNAAVLIATGYAVDAEVQPLVAAGAHILEKPYSASDLRREVSRLLESGEPRGPRGGAGPSAG